MSFTRQCTFSLGTEQVSWSSEAWLSHSDEQSKPTVQHFNKSEQNCGGVATFLSRHWQGPQSNDLRYDQQPDEINFIVNGNFLIVCSSLRFMITLNDNFDIKFFCKYRGFWNARQIFIIDWKETLVSTSDILNCVFGLCLQNKYLWLDYVVKFCNCMYLF